MEDKSLTSFANKQPENNDTTNDNDDRSSSGSEEERIFRERQMTVLEEQSNSLKGMEEALKSIAATLKSMDRSMNQLLADTKSCLATVKTLETRSDDTGREVQNPLLASTMLNITQNNTDTESHNKSSENQIEAEKLKSIVLLNNTFENMNEQLKIQNELNSKMQRKITTPGVHVNRDYKLNSKGNLELWLDLLKSELATNDLLDFWTNPEKFENDNSENTLKKRLAVRGIIINRLDANYHKKILNINEPHKIIDKIKEIRKLENNVSEMTVRQRFYAIKRGRKEKVTDFIDRFESLIREHETCNPETPLSKEEIRAVFYQAVCETSKELVSTYLVKSQTDSMMTIEEMKNCLLQVERSSTSETPRANLAQRTSENKQTGEENRYPDIKCYRCNKYGHYQTSCPLISEDLWFCYACNGVRRHRRDECPNTIQRIP